MEKWTAALFLCTVGGSLQLAGSVNELNLDEALITIHNHLSENVSLFYVSDYCYKCLYQLLISAAPGSTTVPSSASVAVSTRFTLTFHMVIGANNTSPKCSWSKLYGAHGQYSISVQNSSGVSCSLNVDEAPINSYIPLWVALAAMFGVAMLYLLGSYAVKLRCIQDHLKIFQQKLFPCFSRNDPENHGTSKVDKVKSKRLRSLDTFRGLSLTLMVFVNYGGGGYWFFEHAVWNGLTVADLVMPWFVFIIGTSVSLAFNAMLKKGVHRIQLLRKLTWRTIVLFVIGVFFLNYGPMDGPLSWRWVRIPGVLQRLGFTYLAVALMETCFSKKNIQKYETSAWWAPIRDVVIYWPEWMIIAVLETVWLCLTFLFPVPGCPRGYLGPGGIGDNGNYPNCTGGAAGYIDKWLLGSNHVYQNPTCKTLYKTTEPFDPEGILGTINSIVMAFFGLQAGKIILIYRKSPLSILKRFLFWAILLGIISAILTKCTRDEGFIPVNKNLWSLSFISTLSCFAFILLGLMFFIIDVKHWWSGQPFIYPGMNSILIYVGHSLLGSYFPFKWEMKFWTYHYELLFQNLLGTSVWVFIAYLLYRKKFFLKI